MGNNIKPDKIFHTDKNSLSDCVIFMTAYKSNYLSKKLLSFKNQKKVDDLFYEHHVMSLMTKNVLLTPKGSLNIELSFNTYQQKTEFRFSVRNEKDNIEIYKENIDNFEWSLSLLHSLEQLLDKSLFDIPIFINMESFLVFSGSRLLQVDPLVFFLNDVMFICFELIDYDTGVPLSKDDIYGRRNNYNIIPITRMQYFDDDTITNESRKISDIIFANVISFFEHILGGKYKVDQVSFVHNLFVISNSISDITEYFQKVIGEKELNIKLENINSNGAYGYYSKEYLGVVTAIYNDDSNQVLWDVQLLEAMKMLILLNQCINYDLTIDLQNTINKHMYIDQLLFMSGTPIITISTIKNIQQTDSYKRFKESIDFKISYLNMNHERRKNQNALLLNVLLYFLAFIGCISTLQVFQEEFGMPFNISFIILTIVFSVLGIIWIFLEKRK